MINFLEMLGVGKYSQLNFWTEPHPEGKLFYFTNSDVKTVKENVHLEGDQIPSSPEEVVEAATNGLGTLMRTGQNGDLIEFFVSKESVPFAEITLKVFAGLTENQKPEA